jgi:(4-(4-[2-(gamma-L-glutamylamino)ethyl]phenoxymethyl)furan-2-yl)methanamine synthase
MSILAIDIGGANIKLADSLGYAASWPFALWKSPEKLAGKLVECLAAAPRADHIVVTMTGELCDCYETKREGVRAIVSATLEATAGTLVSFYQTTGQFVSADQATENHLLTAASNWHALATFAARYCERESAILIDIGSTTTDIIPIENGKEVARGRTDPERLLSGELVYTGVKRTPVCAIVTRLPWRGGTCLVASEFFATSGDAHLLLGNLSEDEGDTDTADGKPFTSKAAHARLARIVCGDQELVSRTEAVTFAESVQAAQCKMLEYGICKVIDAMSAKPQAIILSGHGEFLARRLVDRLRFSGEIDSLTEKLGPEVSRCAPAHALAVLARES